MTNYQKRMTRFVVVSNAYSVIFIGLSLTGYLPSLEWIIWGTASLLLYALAIGFDAVYDSLKEHIDEEKT